MDSDLQRYLEVVTMYHQNLAEYHGRIEKARYDLGRLDERVGSEEG